MKTTKNLALAFAAALLMTRPAHSAPPANLFPNPAFDRFAGNLPEGWTFDSWNQPAMNVHVGILEPGRNGDGHCLEVQPGDPMDTASLTSPLITVSPGRDYLFTGYYGSTCEWGTGDIRWMNAAGVWAEGKWLDVGGNPIGAFAIILPDTQDRWVEFYDEVRAPDNAAHLRIVITRRKVGGRLRFDDFSLREGRIRDFAAEFSLRSVPDEDFFPIFAWLAPSARHEEPGTNMDGDLQHSQYALANFNVGSSARFGVKYQGSVVADDAEMARLNEDARLWTIHGGDEPREGAFPELGKINERVKRLTPSKPFWVNLLPTYGFDSPEEYDHYIKSYIDTVKPTFFTYDHYCLVGSDPASRSNWFGPKQQSDYFANLEIVRKRAIEAAVDFGVILGVVAHGPVRGASEAELRWQAFTTLAYGSKALGWFTYLTEIEHDGWNYRDAVINRDGTRTRHYAMLKYLNGEVLAWGRTLRKLTSTGVYHTAPLPPMTSPISESGLVQAVNGGMALVGEFKHRDGHSYLMVVNRDFINPATLTLQLHRASGQVARISREDGDGHPAPGYRSETGELRIELGAGDAELFRVD